jgi:hypothetical protein
VMEATALKEYAGKEGRGGGESYSASSIAASSLVAFIEASAMADRGSVARRGKGVKA